jgi:hypothetical protein
LSAQRSSQCSYEKFEGLHIPTTAPESTVEATSMLKELKKLEPSRIGQRQLLHSEHFILMILIRTSYDCRSQYALESLA